jgi:GNAT superfamily N-acetyltransferase
LRSAPGRSATVWLQRREVVALLDIERDGSETAAGALVVAPARRGKGNGTILRSIFSLAEVEGIERIYGEVEQGNVAAEGLARAAGFAPENSAVTKAGFNGWVLSRRATQDVAASP